jgi:sugar lactone lactonase YvrE
MASVRPFALSLIVALAACSGDSSLPVTSNGEQAAGLATFRLSTPAANASGVARSPRYVSPNSQSFVILTDGANPQTLTVSKASPSCRAVNDGGSLSCSIAIRTAAGSHDFTVTSYAGADGQGARLSTNTTGPIVVGTGDDTLIALALAGIVDSARLTLQTTDPPIGTPAKIPLTVVLKDASGAVIVGVTPFDAPIVLTSSDAVNGALSKTTLISPADEGGITANYGGARVSQITYSANGKGLSASNVTNAVLAPAAKAGATKIYVVNNGTFNGNTGGASVATFDAAGNPALPTITAGLNVPDAIAVDAAGKIYVVNEGDRTLVTFAPDGTPSTPTIVEPLGNPFDVAVDAAGKIYLMDFGAGTLLTYKPDGTPTTPVLDGIFNYPAGVAVDAAGKIYVADSERGEYGQVKTFAPDGSPTTPTIGFGRSAPYAVAVDGAGKIYATDTTTNTLTTYAPDGSRTTPTIGALDNPVAVAVDAAGKIYVANANSDTVTAYNPDGTPSTPTITGLHYPMGIAVPRLARPSW